MADTGRHSWALLAAVATGCGRLAFDEVSVDLNVSVEPTYAQATEWNDYVRRDAAGLPSYRQSGAPCDGTEVGPPSTCVHAGEQRMAILHGLTSCSGVNAVDTLGALQWTCDDTTGVATVYSTGLREGKGLRDLLDAAGWKPESLNVLIGGIAHESAPTTWWSNAVLPLPTASTVLDQPGAIYVLAQSRSSEGYSIEADRVALVMVENAMLEWTTGPINCNEATAERTNPDQRCLLIAADQRFLWLEGTYDGTGVASYTVLVSGLRFSQLRGLNATSGTLTSLRIDSSSGVRAIDITANDGGIYGLVLERSDDNVLHDVRTFGNGTRLSQGSAGVFLGDSHRNVLTKIVASSNYNFGILAYDFTSDNTYSHITAGNNVSDGIDLQGSGSSTLVQAMTVNNSVGIRTDSPGNVVAQVAAANGDIALCLADPANRVERSVVLGTSTISDCRTDSVCGSTVACAGLTGSPDFTPGADFSTALDYKVTTDDPANPSDTAGQTASRANITDWLRFADVLRGWGTDGPSFPDLANTGPCSGSCRIWDWRRAAADMTLTVRDASGAQDAAPLVAGQPCPPSVDGNLATSDTAGNTFLINALERLGDGVGDDDGLCESGESCVQSRSFGGDQGWRTAIGTDTCIFRDGVITGVRMHGPGGG